METSIQSNIQEKPKRLLSKDGSIHVTDEFYNTVISSVGALLAAIGVYFLIHQAWMADKPWHVLSFSIYGFCVIILFASSALHHGVDGSENLDHHLRQLDYFAIFLMIAGSFTPFCLILIRNTLGSIVLCVIWFLAIFGIALKAIYPRVAKGFMTALYVGMGWMAVFIAKPIYEVLSWKALALMALGGFFFTGGAIIYLFEKPNPLPGRFGFHEIWHLCVLSGAMSHFFLMYFFLLPYIS